jgi:hypothetical protein
MFFIERKVVHRASSAGVKRIKHFSIKWRGIYLRLLDTIFASHYDQGNHASFCSSCRIFCTRPRTGVFLLLLIFF